MFHHDDAVLLEPVNHVEGFAAILPALIHVDRYGQISLLTNGLYHLLVVVAAELHLEDVELLVAFARLLFHHVTGVYTDGERGRRSLLRVQSPDVVPGCTQELAHEVVEGNVDSGLGSGVTRRQAVNIGEDIVQAEGIGERTEVDLGEKL